MGVAILTRDRWGNIFFASCFVDPSVDHDDVELVMILKNSDVVKWVAINKDAVGEVALLNLSKLVCSHEQFRHSSSGRYDGFMRCEIEMLDEVAKIAGVCAMWSPCKPVISTRENNYASVVLQDDVSMSRSPWPERTYHLTHASDCGVQFFAVAHLLRLRLRISKGCCILEGSDDPVDTWCNNMLRLLIFEHIHTILINITSMVDDINTMSNTHLDRIPSSSMGTKTTPKSVGRLNTSSRLFVREVAILCRSNLGDLCVMISVNDYIISSESDTPLLQTC